MCPWRPPASGRACAGAREITHTLGAMLRERGLSTGVGDEGGFAPDLESDEAAIQAVLAAIDKAGYSGKVQLALDAAGQRMGPGEPLPPAQAGERSWTQRNLIEYWEGLVSKYPILSIEDPLGEEDFSGWAELTRRLGSKVQLVGDDLFVTNLERLRQGIDEGGGKRHSHQAQPDRHPDGDPGLHRAGQAQRV